MNPPLPDSNSSGIKPRALHYNDPGGDYFTRLHPDRTKKRAVNQLEAMGYRVTLDNAS